MTVIVTHDWRDSAACRADPDLFFAEQSEAIAYARHICRRHCPVFDDCADWTAGLPRTLRVGAVLAGQRYDKDGRVAKRAPEMVRVCGRCALEEVRRG
jgi:hypothetical protein